MIIKATLDENSTQYRPGSIMHALAGEVINMELKQVKLIEDVKNLYDESVDMVIVRSALNKIASRYKIRFKTRLSNGILSIFRIS